MDKVLVLGGSGFLGSHVADALSAGGYRVTIFDQQVSFAARPGQTVAAGDILDLDALVAAAQGCRYVYHFAGIADIDEASNRPLDTIRINVLGTANALEAARLAGVERFIFASTVYVYSDFGSFYRVSKQSCEQLIEAYSERYQLDYTILRYGSLYGRRADWRNSIWRMISEATSQGSITYRGDPDSLREYIHVEDAASLSVRVLCEEYRNRHLVLTGTERMRVRDLMRMIAEMLPGNVELRFAEGGSNSHYTITPYRFSPKLGHKLVANDFVDLGQGLLDCIAEIHQQLSEAPQSERTSLNKVCE